jgi:hypothetical protein
MGYVTVVVVILAGMYAEYHVGYKQGYDDAMKAVGKKTVTINGVEVPVMTPVPCH